MKCPDLKQLVLLIFEMMKKWSPVAKTCMLCNMKTNHGNVKFCNKNVNVVEKIILPHKIILQ